MSDLDDMGLFVQIVRAGSLKAAAETTGVPTSTLSRRLARLEQRLGVPLLQRTTRRMRLTRYGETWLQFCERVDEAAAQGILALQAQRDEPTGPLRVAVSFNVDAIWGIELIAEFLQRYPGITLDAQVLAWGVAIDELDLDLIITHGAEPVSHRQVRTLGSLDLVLCASPAYLARRGQPSDAAALAGHDFVLCDRFDWRLYAPSSIRQLVLKPRLVTNETSLARQLALQSMGITWLPQPIVTRHLMQGRLVQVLPDQVGSLPLWMVTPRGKEVNRRIEVLETFIRARAIQSAPWNYADRSRTLVG